MKELRKKRMMKNYGQKTQKDEVEDEPVKTVQTQDASDGENSSKS